MNNLTGNDTNRIGVPQSLEHNDIAECKRYTMTGISWYEKNL